MDVLKRTSLLAGATACLVLASAAGTAAAHSGGGGGGGGHGGGGHGGGGHGGSHIVYYGGGYYGGGFYLIPGTNMPLELLDTAPTAMEGDLTPGVVIAQHTVRIAEARVLTEDFTEEHKVLWAKLTWPLQAGTVLAKVVLYSTPHRELWCQIPKPLKPSPEARFECFSDEGHTGSFTKLWYGTTGNRFLGISFSTADEGRALAKPMPYRVARVEERPVARVGYRWCDGDGVRTPPRFTLATRFDDDDSWTTGGAAWCAAGVWQDPADHAHVDLLGMKLTLAPKADQTFSYKVDGRIAPVPLLGIYRRGFPLRGESAPVTATEAQLLEPLRLGQQPYVRGDTPPSHLEGKVANGAVLGSFVLKRHPTGVLQNRIVLDPKDPGGDALEVGQPMFGYTQKTLVGRIEMVWCAPRLMPDKHWLTWCINGEGEAIRARDPFVPSPKDELGFGRGVHQVASVASVKLQPVDLPAIKVTAVYSDSDLDDASVNIMNDWGEGPRKVGSEKIVFNADGVGRLPLPDGVLTLHRTIDKYRKTSETTAAFQAAVQPTPKLVAPPIAQPMVQGAAPTAAAAPAAPAKDGPPSGGPPPK